jgi:hypothetical protein
MVALSAGVSAFGLLHTVFADGTMAEPDARECILACESDGAVHVTESSDGYRIVVDMPGWYK